MQKNNERPIQPPQRVRLPMNAPIPPSYFEERDLQFLGIRWIPAIFNRSQTAALLGVAAESIGALVGSKFLKPLSKPRRGTAFLFMRDEVLHLCGSSEKTGKYIVELCKL